jgi:uncharacterized delta-60 repeat protein
MTRGLAEFTGALALVGLLGVGCGAPSGPEIPEDPGTEVPPETPPTTTPAFVDTDLGVVRFNADGSLDTTFGTNGTVRLDLGTGIAGARDALWGTALDAVSNVLLFAGRKAPDAARTDSDRVVVRLTPRGELDASFATQGVHTLNIANFSDQARHGLIQPDGKIVSAGYTSQPTGVGTQTANRIVLTRLNADGTTDTTFGQQGIVNSNPFIPADPERTLWGMAEAYGVAFQSGKYVTIGYGRAAATGTVDLVSCRYNADGSLDKTWGVDGVAKVDLVGENDRGRNVTVLPDQRVITVGSASPTKENVDALIAVLDVNGKLDTTFQGQGYATFDFGRADEALFGVAVNPGGTQAAAVGYRAGGSGANDDAVLVLVPLDGGAPVAIPVPLSESSNDRLFTVRFDSAGRILATGFVAEGDDQKMALVRFKPDGTRDESFGANGLVTLNVAAGKADEVARGLEVLSSGQILIAGPIERP